MNKYLMPSHNTKTMQFYIFLPSVQQSSPRCNQALSKLLQLLNPHTKLPAQSESLSQSPSPASQGFEEVQQLQSFLLASQPDTINSLTVSY